MDFINHVKDESARYISYLKTVFFVALFLAISPFTALAADGNITAIAGANGTIAPPGVTLVPDGTNQTYTITPNANYHVADVLVDGGSVGPVTSHDFIGVIADHTIEASFAIDQFTITASAGGDGSINPAGAVLVDYNNDLTFTITPSVGYEVATLMVDGTTTVASTTYTFGNVQADHT
ncbi:MAG: hypothetical protein WAW13_05135, partial [Minisyncoccia bacterium]